jgi:diguanylate cyclase (GGDEF)-like protein
MRRYEQVRLRKGIGWIDAAGAELVLPPDGETFQVAPGVGRPEGFLVYVVDLPDPVAVLGRSSPSWVPEEKAAARLLADGFGIALFLRPDGPGGAVASCHSARADPFEDAACALWALKAKGGWDESPIMTFRITHVTRLGAPSAESVPSEVAWMTARSSDAFRADVSRPRRGGWDAVRAELAVAPSSMPMRVILIDVDWMMSFNDAYTHEQGDLLIARLWSCLEERTGRDGASLVRVGGEEFAVVVNEAVPGAAFRLAEALRQDVESMNIPFHHHERSTLGHVTVSVGIVAPDDPSRLPDDAADAVYDAKRGGRNRVAARE